LAWGFYNAICAPQDVLTHARVVANMLAQGPTVAHATTKEMLHREWSMDLDGAIDAEARAQAKCMQSGDFRRAYEAFAAKRAPLFEGN
jgi:enoyl-CoA hydratase/carnithine racemase